MEMKKLGWGLLVVLALAACKKEIGPEGENPGPEQQPEEVVIAPQTAIGEIMIVTDNGAAVDSKDPADYRPCTVKVLGTRYDATYNLEARGAIRGRGNSTWNWYPKKPYRIKLDESASVLGLPQNRDWVLLADYRDVTHMMNATGFYLAKELGLPHANHIRYVRLILNGQDMGLYALTEQVEEGGNRVKLDKNEGILLALDINDGPDDEPRATNNFWSEVFEMACAVKYPDDATKAISKQVKAAFAELEQV